MNDIRFQSMPADSRVPAVLAHKDFMAEANRILQLPEEAVDAFERAIDFIRNDSHLAALVRHYHQQLFHSAGEKRELLESLLAVEASMGDHAGMFAAVVFVSGLPQAVRLYEAKGIPPRVMTDTFSDFGIWMRNHKEKHGTWGLSQVHWLIHHFTFKIFRLGRLQFMPITFGQKIKAFRHRRTGETIVFSDAGVRFRGDGQVDGTNEIYDRDSGWTSRFAVADGEIMGNPISPDGYASSETTRLPADDWQLELSEGDHVLDVHIPQGGKMAHELCLKSYRQAMEFFPKYFPERAFKAFVCTSWLLSPQFRQILPADSNILMFQRDYHLLPVLSNDRQTFERVFGEKPADLTQAPRDSALRKIILDYYLNGNLTNFASGFLWTDRIPDVPDSSSRS